jgi:hypothetical protein
MTTEPPMGQEAYAYMAKSFRWSEAFRNGVAERCCQERRLLLALFRRST